MKVKVTKQDLLNDLEHSLEGVKKMQEVCLKALDTKDYQAICDPENIAKFTAIFCGCIHKSMAILAGVINGTSEENISVFAAKADITPTTDKGFINDPISKTKH